MISEKLVKIKKMCWYITATVDDFLEVDHKNVHLDVPLDDFFISIGKQSLLGCLISEDHAALTGWLWIRTF